jgi:hypothetical protein
LLGSVQYQSHTEHSGISVKVLTRGNVLLSFVETNGQGTFSIAVPAEEAFILLLEAPLHRRIRLQLEPNISLPTLMMAVSIMLI